MSRRAGLWLLRYGFPGTAFALGTWQVRRLFEKRAHIARLTAAVENEPLGAGSVRDVRAILTEQPWRRIRLHGAALRPGERLLVGPRGSADTPGQFAYEVHAPVALADGDVLVDIGRCAVADAPAVLSALAGAAALPGLEVVAGRDEARSLLLPRGAPERGPWPRRHAAAMTARAACAPGVLLRAVSAQRQSPLCPQLVVGPPRVDVPNRHLEYVLTWYGIALGTALMSAML